MKNLEFTFQSVNPEPHPKPIAALAIPPDKTDENTGVTLFGHGWGGTRAQHQNKMQFASDGANRTNPPKFSHGRNNNED